MPTEMGGDKEKSASDATATSAARTRSQLRQHLFNPAPFGAHHRKDIMKTKHTPGPWGVLTMFGNNLTIGIDYPEGDDRDHYLAEVTCGDPCELEANARLIAAAPELLEALKRVMDNDCPITGNPSHAELVEFWEYEKTQGRGEADDRLFALAAIAKAT